MRPQAMGAYPEGAINGPQGGATRSLTGHFQLGFEQAAIFG